jgi:CO dehydrogenase/acetyl-CoA synthase beta subunit
LRYQSLINQKQTLWQRKKKAAEKLQALQQVQRAAQRVVVASLPVQVKVAVVNQAVRRQLQAKPARSNLVADPVRTHKV